MGKENFEQLTELLWLSNLFSTRQLRNKLLTGKVEDHGEGIGADKQPQSAGRLPFKHYNAR